jgi:uncharacterized protein
MSTGPWGSVSTADHGNAGPSALTMLSRHGHHSGMNPDDQAVWPGTRTGSRLTREECLRLMASVAVGRIVYSRRALPAVEPVHFFMDSGDIVIGADPDGELADATHQAVVAFETDDAACLCGLGWRVTAIGHAGKVTDPGEVMRLAAAPARPARIQPGRERLIRITPSILDGRRLAG